MSLTFENLPPSRSYRTRAAGRDLGETMPMWRVQTEGYEDEKGFLIGVVSYGAGMEDSPDAEFISGGKNAKGPDSVAIGRQGNYLHWGFAASPTHMTDEARLVFVNAIYYISRFDGERPIVRRKTGTRLRSSVDDMLYGLSDEGHAQWTALIDEANQRSIERSDRLRERREAGETLSAFEQQMLEPRPIPAWDRSRTVGYVVPEALRAEFGDDWSRYESYYGENRPYLRPVGEGHQQGLDVDPDARALGIANHDPMLLEACVSMLERDDRPELARRVLERYTLESFDDAAGWRTWLDQNRDRLFFTETAGYTFMVDAAGQAHAAIAAMKPGVTSPASPVAVVATVAPERVRAGESATVILEGRIHPGWHLYSFVPPDQPYITTTLDLKLPEGVTPSGAWSRPETKSSVLAPGLKFYQGEVVFTREIAIAADARGTKRVVVVFDYQACDARLCLPPRTVELPVTITIE